MKQPAKKIDAFSINFATDTQRHMAERTIELANRLMEDTDRKERRKKALCPNCYYDKGRIGGAAITFRPCGCCGTEMSFGSTATDVMCLDCARLLGLCKQCGASVELKRISGKVMSEILKVIEGKQSQIRPTSGEESTQ